MGYGIDQWLRWGTGSIMQFAFAYATSMFGQFSGWILILGIAKWLFRNSVMVFITKIIQQQIASWIQIFQWLKFH